MFPGAVGHGLGTSDNPIFPGMHESAALIAGGSVAAARAIAHGEVDRAVNFFGGLHHAMPDYASGFCIYNDAALAIRALLDAGVQRVAYIDVDVHHGDGVQAAFYDDPRVLTVSIHETPAVAVPRHRLAGRDGAAATPQGTAVNVALPAGTADAAWLRAFHAVVPGVVAAFRPEVLVTQHGADTHREDPLADLNLTRGRAADVLPGAARRSPSGHRRPLAGAGRRRLCPGPGGAAGLDASAGDRCRSRISTRRRRCPPTGSPRRRGPGRTSRCRSTCPTATTGVGRVRPWDGIIGHGRRPGDPETPEQGLSAARPGPPRPA